MSRGALGLSSLKFSLLCFDPGGVFFLPPGWSCAVLQGQVLWAQGRPVNILQCGLSSRRLGMVFPAWHLTWGAESSSTLSSE